MRTKKVVFVFTILNWTSLDTRLRQAFSQDLLTGRPNAFLVMVYRADTSPEHFEKQQYARDKIAQVDTFVQAMQTLKIRVRGFCFAS